MMNHTRASIEYSCEPAQALNDFVLDQVCHLVLTSGGVAGDRVRHNLARAHLIARAEVNGLLVGTSTLKHPRAEYLEGLQNRMGLDLRGFLERGYTAVHPDYRKHGIGKQLVTTLTNQAGGQPVYTLIGESDQAMQNILQQLQYVKIRTFFSELAHKELGLWLSSQHVKDTAK